LSDRDREVRLSAIGLLGSRKWLATILPGVFDALAGAADDEDSLVRAEAFRRMRDIALGHVWNAPAVTRLAASKLRHDSSDSVRANAADLLGVLDGPESCAALVDALDDESVLVRRGVARVLRTMSPPAARAGLVRRRAVETQMSVAGALQGAIDAIDEAAEHKAAR
jgi:HEAT repeat protein